MHGLAEHSDNTLNVVFISSMDELNSFFSENFDIILTSFKHSDA